MTFIFKYESVLDFSNFQTGQTILLIWLGLKQNQYPGFVKTEFQSWRWP